MNDSAAIQIDRSLTAVPAREPLYGYRFSRRFFLGQILFCTVPSAGLLFLGHAQTAGICFWFLFSLMLLRAALMGRRDELLCLILGAAPFMNFFRSYAFYNVVLAIFIAALGIYFFTAHSVCRQVWKEHKLWWGVLIWSCV